MSEEVFFTLYPHSHMRSTTLQQCVNRQVGFGTKTRIIKVTINDDNTLSAEFVAASEETGEK